VLKTGDVWEILSARRLTLSQFVLLHEQFIAQISLDTCYENCTTIANDKSTPDNDDDECDDGGAGDEPIAVSTGIIDSCGKKKDPSASSKGRDICCICMESEAAVILPCYHSFCETCIDAWVASRRSTCPLCRSKLGTRNDRWQVVEELPPDFDVKTEIGRTMLHMALNCGKPFEGF